MPPGGRRKGAGRKAHLEDKTIEEIVNLSANTIKQALEDETLDLEFRADLASKIFVKRMPQIVQGDGQQQILIVRMNEGSAQEVPGQLRVHRSPTPGDGVSLGNGQKSLSHSEGS